jgi:hypothetical protein
MDISHVAAYTNDVILGESLYIWSLYFPTIGEKIKYSLFFFLNLMLYYTYSW